LGRSPELPKRVRSRRGASTLAVQKGDVSGKENKGAMLDFLIKKQQPEEKKEGRTKHRGLRARLPPVDRGTLGEISEKLEGSSSGSINNREGTRVTPKENHTKGGTGVKTTAALKAPWKRRGQAKLQGQRCELKSGDGNPLARAGRKKEKKRKKKNCKYHSRQKLSSRERKTRKERSQKIH